MEKDELSIKDVFEKLLMKGLMIEELESETDDNMKVM